MSELSHLTNEEVELLISLPYRVGVYVSYADDVDGEQDDDLEMAALSACLKAVAVRYDGPGLVDDIVRGTLSAQDHWERWAEEGAFNVLSAAADAMALLRAKAAPVDVRNYRAALLEIAYAVAQAHGEFVEYDDHAPKESGFFAALAEKIVSGFSGMSQEDKGHPANISASEDGAIQRLAATLKLEDGE